ncbi:hypothetical protein HDU92_007400 [Lobulomyces angularis]|nr:hypothetical protein HDU92_007400 [Lobulomyces angularis]
MSKKFKLNFLYPKLNLNAKPTLIPKKVEKTKNKGSERVLWFNDPHLLREHVDIAFKKKVNPNDTINLVLRHLGCANSHVYHALFTNLIQHNESGLAWDTYKKMLRQNKNPSPQSITLFFNVLSKKACMKENSQIRPKLLQYATEFWNSLQGPSVIHLNAYLRVCLHCAEVGGWDSAFIVYSLISERETRVASNLPMPDLISYTTMLSLCAENRCMDGYQAAMDIWNDFLQNMSTEKRISSNNISKKLIVDETILSQILLTCIRVEDLECARVGLEIINKWYGLPIKDSDFSGHNQRNLNYIKAEISIKDISSKTFDVLLRVAARCKEFSIGQKWFSILSESYKIPVDDIVRTTYMNLLIEGNNFDQALIVAESLPPSVQFPHNLKICAAAVSQYQRKGRFEGMNKSKYIQTFMKLIEHIPTEDQLLHQVDGEILRNILFVLYDSEKYLNLGVKLIKNYQDLIFFSTNELNDLTKNALIDMEKNIELNNFILSYNRVTDDFDWNNIRIVGFKPNRAVINMEILILTKLFCEKFLNNEKCISNKEIVIEVGLVKELIYRAKENLKQYYREKVRSSRKKSFAARVDVQKAVDIGSIDLGYSKIT